MELEQVKDRHRSVAGQVNDLIDEWHKDYYDLLNNYAIGKVHDKEAVRDLVQDTFLAALENSNQFNSKSAFTTWLVSILKHKIYHYYRDKSKRIVFLTPDFNSGSIYRNPEMKYSGYNLDLSVFENQLTAKELHYLVTESLRSLPPLLNVVFKKKYLEGQSAEEICNALKISRSSYWVTCHRAKQILRHALRDYPH